MKKLIFTLLLFYSFMAYSENSESPQFAFSVESALSVLQNSLLDPDKNWSIQIPYTEIGFESYFSKNDLFKILFDFNLLYGEWNYDLDDLFVQSERDIFNIPIQLKIGYFHYPISYVEENLILFSSETLLKKNLFPFIDRDPGVLLSAQLWGPVYLMGSVQEDSKKGRLGSLYRGMIPALSASLFYRNNQQEAFLSYFQKDFFLEGDMEAMGLGFDISVPLASWHFGLKGELWNIKRSVPDQNIINYYVFPSIKYHFLSFAFLFGMAHHDVNKVQVDVLEYLLKGEIHFNKNLSFTVEKIKKWDAIVREDFWSFSLRSKFQLPNAIPK